MIYIIRHMQSQANLKNIAGGDYPLTDKGIRDAENLKKQIELCPDFLLVSPLVRAQQTARILFPGKKIITDKTFREIHFGKYEDKPMTDDEFLKIYNTTPSRLHEISLGDVVKKRADEAIIKLLDYWPRGQTVIVSHDTLIRAIMCRLRGEPLDNMPKYKPLVTNGSILSISFATPMNLMNNGKITII